MQSFFSGTPFGDWLLFITWPWLALFFFSDHPLASQRGTTLLFCLDAFLRFNRNFLQHDHGPPPPPEKWAHPHYVTPFSHSFPPYFLFFFMAARRCFYNPVPTPYRLFPELSQIPLFFSGLFFFFSDFSGLALLSPNHLWQLLFSVDNFRKFARAKNFTDLSLPVPPLSRS